MDFPIHIGNLTEEEKQKLETLFGAEEIVLTVRGTLKQNGSYSKTVLASTRQAVSVLCDGEEKIWKITDFEKFKVVRMYGNSIFRAFKKDGEFEDLFRFTNDIVSVCEATVEFFNGVIAEKDPEPLLEMIDSVCRKQKSYCPRCGRSLRTPTSPCLHCSSKHKLISKLFVHMKPELKTIILGVILSAIVTGLNLLPPYLTKTLVDDVVTQGDNPNALRELFIIIALLLSAHIVHYVLAGVKNYILRLSGHKILVSLKNEVYERAQYLPMAFYDKTSSGSVITRINSDTSTLQSFMMRVTQEVIVQFFTLIGIIIIMLLMNWQLTLVSLIPVPLVAIISKRFGEKILPHYFRIWKRNSATSSVLTDTIPGIRVIKSFTNEKESVENFKLYTNDWYETDKAGAKMIVSYPMFISFLVTCGSVLIWALGGIQVLNGTGISLGLLVSFISYTSMFYNPVNFFANLNDSYQNAVAAAERIFDIIDAEPERDFGKGNIPETVKGSIEFKNVSFAYDKAKKVLNNVNLKIEPGDIVGVVGTTGSGKSTLVNLFMRYYDNYDGNILFDGKDIQEIDLDWFRKQIGYVQQESLLFHDTIYNNIAFGQQNITKEQVLTAVDVARAHDFILRQPDGYDSMIGERGVGLSGGEKQRISIARAVLKNPSILVFDEATASVDSETEHQIQMAIEELIGGRTTIMIAHRLSTLSMANKIVVLDKGEIIECGTPADLMAKKGKYYKLVQIQTMSEKAMAEKQAERLDI